MGGGATSLGLGSLGVVAALTLWRTLGGPPWLVAGIATASLILIVAEFAHLPAGIRRMAAGLVALSAIALPFAQAPLQSLSRGIFLGGLLTSLVGAVTLIARCCYRSEHLRALGERLAALPPRRRFFAFTMASQAFSAMLSLAGTNLLFITGIKPDEQGDQAALVATAITRGFSAAIFWSPMFGNMAILLALYPSLGWTQVFPLGLLMAQLSILVSMLMQRTRVSEGPAGDIAAPERPGIASLAPLLASIALFFAMVLTTSTQLHIPITAAIVLCAFPAAYVLLVAMSAGPHRWCVGARKLAQEIRQYPSVVSEATLFMAAGCSGTILAAAFPANWAALLGGWLTGSPLMGICALMLGLMVLSVVGIHPVLTAVFLASTFTPAQLALPPIVHFCAVLTGWGLAASLTPFSVLSMMASRYSRLSIYRVSFGENWAFAAVFTAVSAVILTAAAYALA